MPDEPLFDRAHFDRQTGGDAELAGELSALFRDQCARIFAALTDGSGSAGTRADLAHTLKGSALGMGAVRLAACAAQIEDRLRAGQDARAGIETLAATMRDTLEALDRPL